MKNHCVVIILLLTLYSIHCIEIEYTVTIEVDKRFCEDVKFAETQDGFEISLNVRLKRQIANIPCIYQMRDGKCYKITRFRRRA